MHVLVIASRKGGAGKTTLAGHLAVEAERAGAGPVAIADVDEQGSLAEWWNSREAPTPLFVQTSVADIAEDIDRLRRHGIELLIVDTPPALTAEIGELVKQADLILIPTRPSPHDLRSIGATVELVEHLGKPLLFVLNGAAPRARITAEAITVLSQHGPLAPSIIHQRVDFAASMVDGRTVMELPGGSRSAEEIRRLWAYVDERLSGGTRASARTALSLLPSLPRQEALPASGERQEVA